MSLGTLALSLYLILVGCEQLGILSVSNTILGILALIAGIALLLDSYRPINLWRHNPQP